MISPGQAVPKGCCHLLYISSISFLEISNEKMLPVYAFHAGRWAARRAFSPGGDFASTAATCPSNCLRDTGLQDSVGFSSGKLLAVFITASPADTWIVCLALQFPVLISGKHSQQGLNRTKSNRTEEFGDSSKWITIPPTQGFQYWKLKNDWQQKAVLIKAQQSLWIFPFWQWTFRSDPNTAGKSSH